MVRRLGAALLVAVLAGCASASQPPGPGPTASHSASEQATPPTSGAGLRDLGFQHGPEDLWLPKDLEIVERIDVANNVTLVIANPPGAQVAVWLREELPRAGFRITADAADSLLFRRGEWQGAFTVTGDHCALSLRTDRE